MDSDTRSTLIQLILSLQNYLITDSAILNIGTLYGMTDTQLKEYYLKLQSYFNSCL